MTKETKRKWTQGSICQRAETIASQGTIPLVTREEIANDYLQGATYAQLIDTYFPEICDDTHKGVASVLVGFALEEMIPPKKRKEIEIKRKSAALVKARRNGDFRHVGVIGRGLIPYDGTLKETSFGLTSEKQFILRMLLENRYQNIIHGKRRITEGAFDRLTTLVNYHYNNNRTSKRLQVVYRNWQLSDVCTWPPTVDYAREKGLLQE